jgi:hypothetical protein
VKEGHYRIKNFETVFFNANQQRNECSSTCFDLDCVVLCFEKIQQSLLCFEHQGCLPKNKKIIEKEDKVLTLRNFVIRVAGVEQSGPTRPIRSGGDFVSLTKLGSQPPSMFLLYILTC